MFSSCRIRMPNWYEWRNLASTINRGSKTVLPPPAGVAGRYMPLPTLSPRNQRRKVNKKIQFSPLSRVASPTFLHQVRTILRRKQRRISLIDRKPVFHDASCSSRGKGQVQSPQTVFERQRQTCSGICASPFPFGSQTPQPGGSRQGGIANQILVPILDTLDSVRSVHPRWMI